MVVCPWLGQEKDNRQGMKFREEPRAWSMKFPEAPESTRALKTTLEEQQLVNWEPERVWRKTIMEYSRLPWEMEGHGAAPLL